MKAQFRALLSGGDRRSIADSQRVRALIERRPPRLKELAALTTDDDWLVTQRALDLLEKFAHEHPEWVEPYKKVFIGSLAESDKWEIRLQVVRALPLFRWTPTQMRRVEAILTANVSFPQTFVRAWALDGLATLSVRRPRLASLVMRQLAAFEDPNRARNAAPAPLSWGRGGRALLPRLRSPRCRARHSPGRDCGRQALQRGLGAP